jgi:hypothetical protein
MTEESRVPDRGRAVEEIACTDSSAFLMFRLWRVEYSITMVCRRRKKKTYGEICPELRQIFGMCSARASLRCWSCPMCFGCYC